MEEDDFDESYFYEGCDVIEHEDFGHDTLVSSSGGASVSTTAQMGTEDRGALVFRMLEEMAFCRADNSSEVAKESPRSEFVDRESLRQDDDDDDDDSPQKLEILRLVQQMAFEECDETELKTQETASSSKVCSQDLRLTAATKVLLPRPPELCVSQVERLRHVLHSMEMKTVYRPLLVSSIPIMFLHLFKAELEYEEGITLFEYLQGLCLPGLSLDSAYPQFFEYDVPSISDVAPIDVHAMDDMRFPEREYGNEDLSRDKDRRPHVDKFLTHATLCNETVSSFTIEPPPSYLMEASTSKRERIIYVLYAVSSKSHNGCPSFLSDVANTYKKLFRELPHRNTGGSLKQYLTGLNIPGFSIYHDDPTMFYYDHDLTHSNDFNRAPLSLDSTSLHFDNNNHMQHHVASNESGRQLLFRQGDSRGTNSSFKAASKRRRNRNRFTNQENKNLLTLLKKMSLTDNGGPIYIDRIKLEYKKRYGKRLAYDGKFVNHMKRQNLSGFSLHYCQDRNTWYYQICPEQSPSASKSSFTNDGYEKGIYLTNLRGGEEEDNVKLDKTEHATVDTVECTTGETSLSTHSENHLHNVVTTVVMTNGTTGETLSTRAMAEEFESIQKENLQLRKNVSFLISHIQTLSGQTATATKTTEEDDDDDDLSDDKISHCFGQQQQQQQQQRYDDKERFRKNKESQDAELRHMCLTTSRSEMSRSTRRSMSI